MPLNELHIRGTRERLHDALLHASHTLTQHHPKTTLWVYYGARLCAIILLIVWLCAFAASLWFPIAFNLVGICTALLLIWTAGAWLTARHLRNHPIAHQTLLTAATTALERIDWSNHDTTPIQLDISLTKPSTFVPGQRTFNLQGHTASSNAVLEFAAYAPQSEHHPDRFEVSFVYTHRGEHPLRWPKHTTPDAQSWVRSVLQGVGFSQRQGQVSRVVLEENSIRIDLKVSAKHDPFHVWIPCLCGATQTLLKTFSQHPHSLPPHAPILRNPSEDPARRHIPIPLDPLRALNNSKNLRTAMQAFAVLFVSGWIGLGVWFFVSLKLSTSLAEWVAYHTPIPATPAVLGAIAGLFFTLSVCALAWCGLSIKETPSRTSSNPQAFDNDRLGASGWPLFQTVYPPATPIQLRRLDAIEPPVRTHILRFLSLWVGLNIVGYIGSFDFALAYGAYGFSLCCQTALVAACIWRGTILHNTAAVLRAEYTTKIKPHTLSAQPPTQRTQRGTLSITEHDTIPHITGAIAHMDSPHSRPKIQTFSYPLVPDTFALHISRSPSSQDRATLTLQPKDPTTDPLHIELPASVWPNHTIPPTLPTLEQHPIFTLHPQDLHTFLTQLHLIADAQAIHIPAQLATAHHTAHHTV